MPPFSPSVHGFRFTNDHFANNVVPQLQIRTQALCGGMAYSALDYYFANKPVPEQPFRPAPGTALRQHIYNRQVQSITNNLDKWGELFVNPGGVRNTEFFNWGISARIHELKALLDNGIPCVLGFIGGSGWGHQVVACGYSMGRYKGDLGPYVEDFKLHVYDPNIAGTITTIVADRAAQVFRRLDGSGEWRTYFVDTRYQKAVPPSVASPHYPNDGKVRELLLEFASGAADLRGGADNVNVSINLNDGSQQKYQNINLGSRWVVGSDEFAQLLLTRPVRLGDVRNIEIDTTFRNGTNPARWDMTKLTLWSRSNGSMTFLKNYGGNLFAWYQNVLVEPVSPTPALPFAGLVHLQGLGDQAFASGAFAGTRLQSRRLEGFQVSLLAPVPGLGLEYRAHLQGIGDTPWLPAGQFVGTRGQGRRLEGFAMRLTGPQAANYVVQYMAHVSGLGDQPFVRNGEFVGTRGQGLAIEGMQVEIFKKVAPA